ncbi:exocyst complex component 1 [Leptidea sinapis]|uniref:exocyst complex component 1 n=1 Tax=Leptidea sinapis TaxID=189913 RepID=UPI0021C35644|nr:exocyst complex component 1 [Leptidea sinapis]
MKLEEGVTCSVLVVSESSLKQQRLVLESGGTLVLYEGSTRLRSWPLHVAKLRSDLPSGGISVETNGETTTWRCDDEAGAAELCRAAGVVGGGGTLSGASLSELLEEAACDVDEPVADAERRVKQLGERLARLDALNVSGMLAAATEGGGARLAASLHEGSLSGAALSARAARLEALTRAGAGVSSLAARGGAARAEAAARALLVELQEIHAWLEPPALADIDSLHEISLATSDGRARAASVAEALRNALRAERTAPPARLRLAGVRDRLRRLARARDLLTASLARHLNNALIHLANEASGPAAATASPRRHHAELTPYAPFMRWLKEMDEKAYDALLKVYVSTWSKVYERELTAACEAARVALTGVAAAGGAAQRTDPALDEVLSLMETLCNSEQDFCSQFFALDLDCKSDSSDGERSERSEKSEGERVERRMSSDTRRVMGELFPALLPPLTALLTHLERHDPYGAMRALACVSRRVLGETETEGEARWSRGILAALAVAAKRAADRAVAERLAALPDAVRQASKKPKCGIFSFISELEEMSAVCEEIFAKGRRADLDRWYLSLCSSMVAAIGAAEHPRTPRAVLQLENYHRLHAAVSALRVPALDAVRRDTRAKYNDALRHYVTHYFGRPLDKITQFFEGVAEAVAAGAREEEVCYRTAYSKHQLRKLLALYPAAEVRKSLHRLYRTVEKHLSSEGGLLQVVWRAMQEEFIAQHVALQARIAACYPGAGLVLPLSTQDILDAFSDIAREH